MSKTPAAPPCAAFTTQCSTPTWATAAGWACRIKAHGFLEVAFKVGRRVTTGARFTGLFKDRTWDKVDGELAVGLDATAACRKVLHHAHAEIDAQLAMYQIGHLRRLRLAQQTRGYGITAEGAFEEQIPPDRGLPGHGGPLPLPD